MEIRETPVVTVKKPILTPKAIIFQKFGSNACYKVEEVQEATQNECPGLAIPQKSPCLFRCSLQLPELTVVSEAFKRKKDAEQSAAEKALEKLGIHSALNNLVAQDPWEDLIARIPHLFSNEILSSLHPVSGHIKAALRRDGDHNGMIPVSVIAACDTKLGNLCRSINAKVERNPSLAISLIIKAAARLSGSVVTSEGQLWMRRQGPYLPEVVHSSTNQQSSVPDSIGIDTIYIPWSLDMTVELFTLNVSSNGYYLDGIAQKLGLPDVSRVLLSRTIGKASSEMRFYFSAPEAYLSDLSSDLLNGKEVVHYGGSYNARASYFSGQDIYGDAILASIGYTWRSADLFHEDLSLRSYYRMLINKIPSGVYKLSREAILAAELPVIFTTRTNWKGSSPRDLLCMFCRQHRLSEPIFSTASTPKASSEFSGSHKKLKLTESVTEEANYVNGKSIVASDGEGNFKCEIKIVSKCQDSLIECSPKDSYKKQSDAIQNASLKVLLWLNTYFKQLDMPYEMLISSASVLDIQLHLQNIAKEFSLCLSIHGFPQRSEPQGGKLLDINCTNQLNVIQEHGIRSLKIEGPSGVSPSNGTLVGISYVASLVTEGEDMKEFLESNSEFEFEIGAGAVVPHLEAVVTQMAVDQSAGFIVDMPSQVLILAAASDSAKVLPLLSSGACSLEYSVTLLRVTEPLEDRMEQAFFSPPLSKQRVEFAVRHIRESGATNLIDFGCGSGSLLDSLLDYQSSLERIVGVDISQKSLVRAAKMLHSKLNTNSAALPSKGIKSAVLYDGSVTVFDSRLFGFDIGTCLEVIEHMEEDQACLFGDVVLSSFCPKILIVSTPNYEYNVILKKSSLPNQEEEDPDDKSESQACKFRNHDHKFEWTREQFNQWASDLAARHDYSVEFSGVGGSGDLEPGFASQIAVFRRGKGDDCMMDVDSDCHYKAIWEWDSSNK